MKCKYPGCQDGHYCYGFHPAEYVTRDMARDAGDLCLEGSLYRQEEYEWGACPCCQGEFENCPTCTADANADVINRKINNAFNAKIGKEVQKLKKDIW